MFTESFVIIKLRIKAEDAQLNKLNISIISEL